jgi:hypothetical protein
MVKESTTPSNKALKLTKRETWRRVRAWLP